MLVYKLNKALYRIKQAPRSWFECFRYFLLNALQFSASLVDCCLFIMRTERGSVFILVYVDDIVVTGSDSVEVEQIISQINDEFKLKDLDILNYFIGMEV